MPFEIVSKNIVEMDVDAIVNAANTSLRMGGGVCGAIYSSAGITDLQNECEKIGGTESGKAVITKGYKLKAKYIIHTAGPRYIDGNHNEREILVNSYNNSLALAKENGLKSIAFPLLSSGIYHYPKAKALEVAVDTILRFSKKQENADMYIYLALLQME
jgi:O-acetyl-ADP-ribose deacetylase (regulator of RNase III)